MSQPTDKPNKLKLTPMSYAVPIKVQSLVEFDIAQVLEIKNASFLRWLFGEYSPVNPA